MRAGWQATVPLLAVLLALGHGCSSSNAGAIGPPGDAGGDDQGGLVDASGDAPLYLDASSCQPGDVASFQPPAYSHATGGSQGKCISTMVDQFYDACVGPSSSQQACDAFTPDADATRAGCAACILSRSSAQTYGPIVLYGSVGIPNVAGCIELLDPTASGLACAKAVQADDDCDIAACEANCPLSNPAEVQAFESCTVAADAAGCKTYADPANACLAVEADAGAGSCAKLGFHDLALLFCGPAAASDAGTE